MSVALDRLSKDFNNEVELIRICTEYQLKVEGTIVSGLSISKL